MTPVAGDRSRRSARPVRPPQRPVTSPASDGTADRSVSHARASSRFSAQDREDDGTVKRCPGRCRRRRRPVSCRGVIACWCSLWLLLLVDPARRLSPAGQNAHEGHPVSGGPHGTDVRRRPTLPRGLPRSTIGADGLSFRVRNGTGRFPVAVAAETLWRCGWEFPTVSREPHSGREAIMYVVKSSAY